MVAEACAVHYFLSIFMILNIKHHFTYKENETSILQRGIDRPAEELLALCNQIYVINKIKYMRLSANQKKNIKKKGKKEIPKDMFIFP